MVIAIFYSIVLIAQIIFIVKSIIKKDTKWLNISRNVNAAMLLSLVLFIPYMIKISSTLGMAISFAFIFLILAILIFYVSLLIIYCIVMFIINRRKRKLNIDNSKIEKSKKTNAFKLFNINSSGVKESKKQNVFIIIFCLSIIVLVLDCIPYNIKMKNWNEIKDQTVEYLTSKYGDGNFNVEKMNDTEYQLNFIPTSYEYVLTVSSSYMDDEFEVTIDKDSLEIESEEFLETYYGSSSSFKSYVKKYFVDELNNQLSQNYNATIGFYDYEYNYENINFGHVPSLGELSNYIELIIPKFTINEKMTSADELLDYITEISAFYINNLQRDYITYSSQNKYILFLYNYSNLEGLASNHYIRVRFSSDNSTITIKYLDNDFSYDIFDMISENE